MTSHNDYNHYNDYIDYNDYRDSDLDLVSFLTQLTITDKLQNLKHDIEG